MKKTLTNKKLIKSEKGSVMMEYLILNLGFFVILAVAAHFFLPGDTGYGGLGNAFLSHYNMVLDIVSMPYP